ncbi:methyltransferase domain-containing protein [Streptomyces sp. NPDC059740]|uniref:methyltransferase domain-containing protein n=1 Tax=Streptomyces sp. NPDC059740 TaxID=3346926 RepID=UPI003663B310
MSGEAETSAGARVSIDPSVCRGTGTCEAMAPDLFRLDGEGRPRALRQPLADGQALEAARAVADCCPTGAIEVVSGEQGPAHTTGTGTATPSHQTQETTMAESGTLSEAEERRINRLWENNYDDRTLAVLERLPFQPTWRCVDVGAGSGSMARRLAERVPRGEVLAVDNDIRFLQAGAARNLTVRRMDVTREDLPAADFDFVLLRAVLSAVKDPDDLLDRATRWLAPGGWLLTEDFYFMPSEDGPTANGRKVVEAYLKAFEAGGANPRIGRLLPSRLARAGLEEISTTIRPLGPGQGEAENALMRARMEIQGQGLVDNGLLTREDIDEFLDAMDRPEACDVTTLGFSVWGRRPPA